MAPRRILVVDDDPLIALMLQDWLAELGCEVIGPANSVNAALALLDGGPIDGAVLDVELRNETCYALAEVLQERSVPVVFATGHGAGGIDARFKHVTTVAKPFDFEGFQRAIAGFTR